MAWIESHQSLAHHPKTARLGRALGCSKHEAIGILHCLWWWALDYAEDGNIGRFDAAEVADGCQWDKEPEALLAGLRVAGFLDPNGIIHDWDEYAGRLIENRRRDAARKREARGRETSPSLYVDRPKDVRRTADARPGTVHSTNQPTQPTQPTNNTNQPRAMSGAASAPVWWGWFVEEVEREPNKQERKELEYAAQKGRLPPEYALRFGLAEARVKARNADAIVRYALKAATGAPLPESPNGSYPDAPLTPEQRAEYDARYPAIVGSPGSRNGVRGVAGAGAADRRDVG